MTFMAMTKLPQYFKCGIAKMSKRGRPKHSKDEYKELLVDRIFGDNQVGIVKLSPSHLKLIREQSLMSD